MLFVVCYTQPINCMGVLPLTSVVPSNFSSTGQHSIYRSPWEELLLSVLCAAPSYLFALSFSSSSISSFTQHRALEWKNRSTYWDIFPDLFADVRIWSLLVCTLWPTKSFSLPFPKLQSCYAVSCFCQLLRSETTAVPPNIQLKYKQL